MTWLDDMTAERFEVAGVSVRIVYDEDARNPYDEFEPASRLLVRSRVRREFGFGAEYPFGSNDNDIPSAVAVRWLTMLGGYAIALPFEFADYGSSGARAYISEPSAESASGGYVVIDRHKAESEFLPSDRLYAFTKEDERREFYATAERCARAEFGEFAHYVAGETFGYVAGEGFEDEDSCYGFYGETYVREEATAAAEHIAAERARLRALPWLPTFGRPIGVNR